MEILLNIFCPQVDYLWHLTTCQEGMFNVDHFNNFATTTSVERGQIWALKNDPALG